jgi:hypothetical protein
LIIVPASFLHAYPRSPIESQQSPAGNAGTPFEGEFSNGTLLPIIDFILFSGSI